MEQVGNLWKPLIGQMAWLVRRGVGSFLTMEFGAPHLSVREPITPTATHSAKVRRDLLRRRVFVEGDWHFWIQYADWALRTNEGSLDHNNTIGSALDQCLIDLEGQRLISVGPESIAHSIAFTFDLGAVLEIGPSAEIPDTQWSLHSWN